MEQTENIVGHVWWIGSSHSIYAVHLKMTEVTPKSFRRLKMSGVKTSNTDIEHKHWA